MRRGGRCKHCAPSRWSTHLPDAIADISNGCSQTCALTLTVEITGAPRPLITGMEVTLFWVGQEALTRHYSIDGAKSVLDDDC